MIEDLIDLDSEIRPLRCSASRPEAFGPVSFAPLSTFSPLWLQPLCSVTVIISNSFTQGSFFHFEEMFLQFQVLDSGLA